MALHPTLLMVAPVSWSLGSAERQLAVNVGNSVRKAIDEWEGDEPDAAMLHACNAIDGTAKKVFQKLRSNARFTQLLRDNYSILGPMGMPGINLAETRFPVKVERPKAPGGKPDLADIIYGIHRCSQEALSRVRSISSTYRVRSIIVILGTQFQIDSEHPFEQPDPAQADLPRGRGHVTGSAEGDMALNERTCKTDV